MKNPWLRTAALACLAAMLAVAGCKSGGGSASNGQAPSGASATAKTRPETINYQILLANDKIADKFGGIIGLPTSMLYGRDGRKVKTVMGLINYSDLSKAIEEQLAAPAGDNSGPTPPEASLEIPTLDGGTTSIAQYKGKVVLVNFWATWCQPCRVEIPWLIEFNNKYGPKGLVILGMAMDDEGKKVVEPWVKNQKFDVDDASAALPVQPPASGN